MRTRAFLLAAALTAAAGCGSSPTQPEATAATRWEGTFTITSCQPTGSYSNCFALSPGAEVLAGLLLQRDGTTVSGFAQTTTYAADLLRREAIEGGFLRQFQTTVQPDGSLRFSVTNGSSPTFVFELSWDLRMVSESRMEGTLTERQHWYKQPGDFRATGTVTLTKQ